MELIGLCPGVVVVLVLVVRVLVVSFLWVKYRPVHVVYGFANLGAGYLLRGGPGVLDPLLEGVGVHRGGVSFRGGFRVGLVPPREVHRASAKRVDLAYLPRARVPRHAVLLDDHGGAARNLRGRAGRDERENREEEPEGEAAAHAETARGRHRARASGERRGFGATKKSLGARRGAEPDPKVSIFGYGHPLALSLRLTNYSDDISTPPRRLVHDLGERLRLREVLHVQRLDDRPRPITRAHNPVPHPLRPRREDQR